MNRHLLNDTGIKQRAEFPTPARRLAHDHQIVRSKFVLIQNAGGRVRCGFQFQDHGAAVLGDKLDLVVTQRITPGVLVAGTQFPVFRRQAFFAQDIQRHPQSVDAGQFKARFKHVLTCDANLQAA